MKILMGFPHSEQLKDIVDSIAKEFNNQKISVEIAQKFRKLGIEEWLTNKREFKTLILQEYLEYNNPIDSIYLDKLTDVFSDVNIVFILQDKYYKTKHIKKFFDINIYNCIFEKDATIDNIVNLCLKGRNKKEAKLYYGLNGSVDEFEEEVYSAAIPSATLDSVLNYLSNLDDSELNEGYDYIASKYSELQNIYIIKHFSEDLKEKLDENINYKRFKEILNQSLEKEEAVSEETENIKTEKKKLNIFLNMPSFTFKKKSNNEKMEVTDDGAKHLEKTVPKESVDGTKEKIIRIEKIVYRAPDDYKKIIGIYNPCKYPVGKTVVATNLAEAYAKQGQSVTLIDTDYTKKDIVFYYDINPYKEYNKFTELFELLNKEEPIGDIDEYSIHITKNLNVFTEERNAQYKLNHNIIREIIKYSNSNLIIIDISRDLSLSDIDNLLLLCDERLLVVDKNQNSLDSLRDHFADFNNHNYKNLSLVVNKDCNVRNLKNKEIENKLVSIITNEREEDFLFSFKNIMSIPDDYILIAESMVDKDRAYGKVKGFDESINKMASSLYAINSKQSSILGKIGGFLKLK